MKDLHELNMIYKNYFSRNFFHSLNFNLKNISFKFDEIQIDCLDDKNGQIIDLFFDNQILSKLFTYYQFHNLCFKIEQNFI